MKYVLLQDYNNYYNRMYKREETKEAYITAVGSSEEGTLTTNFEMRDGVNTEQIFNSSMTSDPNYLLLLADDGTTILSRWFVTEWFMIRGGQYRATLRRDLLADNYEAITTAPAFIEKGFVPNTDSAIFNKEDMTFNQIKTSEQILRDDSKTAWIVGFISTGHPNPVNRTFKMNSEVDFPTTFENWEYYDYCDGQARTYANVNNSYFRFYLRGRQYNYLINQLEFTRIGSSHSVTETGSTHRANWWIEPWGAIQEIQEIDWASYFTNDGISTALYADNTSWSSESTLSYLSSLNGRILTFTNKSVKITVISNTTLDSDFSNVANTSNLYTYMYNRANIALANAISDGRITERNENPVQYRLSRTTFTVTFEEVPTPGTYKYSIPASVRALSDAPYKMFCMPYYKDVVTTNPTYGFSLDGRTRTDCDADLMLAWAMDIAAAMETAIYDLQILPYCPLSNWRGRSGNTNAAVWSMDKTVNVDYIYLTETVDETTYSRGICSFCDVSTKEQVLTQYATVIGNPKIANQCYSWRLCSPNYASVFEFNAAMNGGVEGYNVRYTYKPYQSFINVAPIFGRLYGKDFKDNRGLICAGDFSLPIIRDAWIQYQLNNKNYQLAFDRQIENMEVQYDWQRKQSILSAVVGTVQGGATGAAAGGMAGGVGGAIAGGVIGTAATMAGGVMDLEMQKALHNEAIDFAKDNFGYQLGNIRALPNTLNKVSSIVANSKFFPFVETYNCTDEERKALQDKIKYNGMSIGRIGQILDFLNPNDTTYVKGQIIRLEGNFDTHTVNEIANEFMKGWYI